MSDNPYVAFLPEVRRAAASAPPEESWWSWEGHRVHIARARRPESPLRLLLIHGAGGHSGALWPLAALLADRGLEAAAVDLPLYGRTISPRPEQVRYDHWVQLLCDLVAAEHDGRPLVVLGASIGGLLGLEVAARTSGVAAVVATCLIDPASLRTQAHLTRFGPLGVLAGPLSLLARGRLAATMVPMRWMAALGRMSRDTKLSRLCAVDPLGGGSAGPARLPGFLAAVPAHPAEPDHRPGGAAPPSRGRLDPGGAQRADATSAGRPQPRGDAARLRSLPRRGAGAG
ncbi:MAG: alpha/beta fold hydrolase [Propionibacteriaceae bacterium]|nr:alpha/beta fold hydrolase [Propionibacteriaceae bacterium]